MVPGLGGFLCNQEPASADSEGWSFSPSFRKIGFNAQLRYNDGLLAQAYQEDGSLSFEEANGLIREKVSAFRQELATGKHITLGRVGTLYEDEQGGLAFVSIDSTWFDADSFGLKPFSCLPVSNSSEAVPAVEKRVEAVPLSLEERLEHRMENRLENSDRRVGNRMRFVAAACVLLLLAVVSRPLLHENPLWQDASVIPSCALETISVVPATPVESAPVEAAPVVSVSDAETAFEPLTETASESVGVSQPAPVSENAAPVMAQTNVRQYHIIIASFETRADAERYIASRHLSDAYPQVGVLSGNGHHRVYAEKVTQREAAVSRLESFRSENPRYAKAWLLLH